MLRIFLQNSGVGRSIFEGIFHLSSGTQSFKKIGKKWGFFSNREVGVSAHSHFLISIVRQASLICGSVVAPLGEKERPLKKNKVSGSSEGLEPLSTSTGATTGSTGAATRSTAVALVSIGTSRGPNTTVSGSTWPILLDICKTMPFSTQNLRICHFCGKTLTYNVFGPNNLEIRARRIFFGNFMLGEEAAY